MSLKSRWSAYLDEALAQGYKIVDPPLLCDASSLFYHLGESVQNQFFVGHIATGERYLLRPDITLSLCMLFSRKTAHETKRTSKKWIYDSSAFFAQKNADHTESIVEKRQVGIELYNHKKTYSMDMEALKWVLKSLSNVQYTLYLSHLGVLDAFIDALPVNTFWHRRLKRVLRMGNKRTLTDLLQKHTSRKKRGNDALRLLELYDMKKKRTFLKDTPLIGVRTRSEIAYRYEQNQTSLDPHIFAIVKELFYLMLPPYEALKELTRFGRQLHMEQRIKPALKQMEHYCQQIKRLDHLPEKTFFTSLPSGALSYYCGSLFSCHAHTTKNEQRIIAGGGNYSHLLRTFTGREGDRASGATLYVEELDTIPAKN